MSSGFLASLAAHTKSTTRTFSEPSSSQSQQPTFHNQEPQREPKFPFCSLFYLSAIFFSSTVLPCSNSFSFSFEQGTICVFLLHRPSHDPTFTSPSTTKYIQSIPHRPADSEYKLTIPSSLPEITSFLPTTWILTEADKPVAATTVGLLTTPHLHCTRNSPILHSAYRNRHL